MSVTKKARTCTLPLTRRLQNWSASSKNTKNRLKNSNTADGELIQLSHLYEWIIGVISELSDRKKAYKESVDLLEEKKEKELVKQYLGLKLMIDEVERFNLEKQAIECEIEKKANSIIPSVTAILGPIIGARLLAQAGSLIALSRMPSSTVQVLGAEKSLFRHLTGKGSSPKHGLIFVHNFIHSLPVSKRGKMARFMANKISMASRLDFYGRHDQKQKLADEVRRRFEELSS